MSPAPNTVPDPEPGPGNVYWVHEKSRNTPHTIEPTCHKQRAREQITEKVRQTVPLGFRTLSPELCSPVFQGGHAFKGCNLFIRALQLSCMLHIFILGTLQRQFFFKK